MAGEWVALLKAALSPVLQRLPGFVMGWWYPILKCQNSLLVSTDGVGPHIYINPNRAPAIVGLKLCLMNNLPFAVKIGNLHLELDLESRSLTNCDHLIRETVQGGRQFQINVSDIHLSDGQTRIIKQHQGESAILKSRGYVQFSAPAGESAKEFDVETRAFIYRG